MTGAECTGGAGHGLYPETGAEVWWWLGMGGGLLDEPVVPVQPDRHPSMTGSGQRDPLRVSPGRLVKSGQRQQSAIAVVSTADGACPSFAWR